MKAIVQDGYGSADALRLEDVDIPEVGDGDVRVRVHAAGVDMGVWHSMTGLPYLGRLWLGVRRPKVRIRGLALAGTVEAVGATVTQFRPGDEVFGTSVSGSFAEYALAREDNLAAKPENLTFDHAAAVPVSAQTALQALRDHGRVQAGDKVLVIGASGGVGTFAVQIAKALGAEVTGVCSTAKVDLVRSVGADHVIDYTRDGLGPDSDARYEVVLDIAGNRPLPVLRDVLTPQGRLVIVGGENGGRWTGGMGRNLRATALSPFVDQSLVSLFGKEHQKDLRELRELIEAGKVTPVVETLPLAEAPEALRRIAGGHGRGKLVLTI
jgi:NADPH:quinone reductase-like Zn-dependent oxidoreductase